MAGPGTPPMVGSRQRLPGWLANLLLFGLLIAAVLAAFFWQMDRISKSLQRNAMDRSRMVAAVIEENLHNATLAGTTIDEIVTSFLRDKAGFVQYLDSVEPMRQEELTALARETGLLGISLVRPGNRVISGPGGWLPKDLDCSMADGHLYYRDQEQIGYLSSQAKNGEQDLSCIILGLDAARIISLRQKTSLPVLLSSLSALPGINYIRLQAADASDETGDNVTLQHEDNTITAVTRTKTSLGVLEVGLDAHYFLQRRFAIKKQFILFGTILLALGIFFSWLLYRYQQRDLQQVTDFERMLAREHEAAALGRATATIAHEVRNPLNAINMGLQRLQIESDNLDPDQQEMLSAMREAVARTSTIVTELQRFTRKLQPTKDPVRLDELISQVLTLYKPVCSSHNIKVNSSMESDHPVAGDRELLAEMLENLLKNSVEAQLDGGCIEIGLHDEQNRQTLTISNPGFALKGDDRTRPGEPYFTSKTRGTGLGLALCRRIAEAHDGQLQIVTAPTGDTFTVQVTLPLHAGG